MKKMAMLLQLALSLLAAIGCFRSGQVGAMTHIVGGNLGWHLPVANLSFYQDWAKPRNFTAGDKLGVFFYSKTKSICTQNSVVPAKCSYDFLSNERLSRLKSNLFEFFLSFITAFLYTSGLHNVVEVKKDDYDACTQKHVIDKHNNGPTILELSRSGDNYFICGIGSHCEGGQKLSISVINGDHETSDGGGVFGFIGDKSTSADSIRSSGMLISSLLLALTTVLLMVRWSW